MQCWKVKEEKFGTINLSGYIQMISDVGAVFQPRNQMPRLTCDELSRIESHSYRKEEREKFSDGVNQNSETLYIRNKINPVYHLEAAGLN
jgi:hypothetical protein